MIEWLMVPALMGVAALVPGGTTDKKKIQTIFETVGYGVPNKERKKLITPKFKKKVPILDGTEEIGTRYFYTIPLGLPASKMGDEEKRMSIFADGLGRPVVVKFAKESKENPKKYLQISVYNREIPELYPYSLIPKLETGEWKIPLGKGLEGLVWHNFDHVPHMTIAGTTRFGKTVFLKVLMTWLIEHHGEDVEFYIIDLKGGLEFGKFENLKQVKGVASNLEEAYDLLFHLTNEHTEIEIKDKKGKVVKTIELPLGVMQKDYQYFKAKGLNDITKTNIKRRRFILVDEAAQIAPEKWMNDDLKKKMGFCQYALGEISRLGGGLGYRLVYATQYPTADTLPRQIKQNADGKVTTRLPSGYASDVAIDERGAENLPSDVRGRILYKTHELKEMQVPLIEDKEMFELLAPYFEERKMEDETSFNEFGEETTTPRTNLVEPGTDAVCDKGTNPATPQAGNGSKRPKGTKRTKTVPPRSEPSREKRLLPKRKGKGVGRDNEGGQMDPPSRTSLT